MKYLLSLGLLFVCGFTTIVSAQQTAEEALMLTGKTRYHEDVLAFYSRWAMDTTSRMLHMLKSDNGLVISWSPFDNFQTVHQVNLSEPYQGPLPLRLSWGMSEEAVEALTAPSLAVSPKYLASFDVSQALIVKGGLAIVLGFTKHRLTSLYTIGATAQIQSFEAWRAAPFESWREGCISGDCQDRVSVYASGRDIHVGGFQNGKRHGYIQSFLDNGDFYHGKFQEGRRVDGVYFLHQGARFSGQYNEKGQPYKGTITYANGNIFTGENNNGKPVDGKMTYASGTTFTGRFKPDGNYENGTVFIPKDGSFTGTFDANNNPLNGTFKSLNGTSYTIVNGKKQ